MDVTKPYKFIWLGDIHGPKPYEIIGFRWPFISQPPARRTGMFRPLGIWIRRLYDLAAHFDHLGHLAVALDLLYPGQISAGFLSGRPEAGRRRILRFSRLESGRNPARIGHLAFALDLP